MADSFETVISRRYSWLQKAAALAPALLLLVYLPAQLMLRCRMDGLLREACCCSPSSEPESPGPVAKAQDCCDREVASLQRPNAAAASPTVRELAPVATVAVLPSAAPSSAGTLDRFYRAAQRHGPPREGPRIVLLKQSFLI